MNKMKVLCIAIGCIAATVANAQKDYARKVVDTLASPYMAGRGYTDEGDKKAAKYISDQMKSFGLLHFGQSYEQLLSFNVNTFPDNITVSVNGKAQDFGVNYIVMPNSNSTKGTFKVVRFTRATMLDKARMYEFKHQDHTKEFILVDDTGVTDANEKIIWQTLVRRNPYNARGFIVLCNKLTEETSDSVAKFCLLNALRKSVFDSATIITIDVKNKLVKNYTSQNLIGYIKGSVADTFIVFSAHYDHLGKMGNAYFPGANDNASGTAMLLSLAKYYSTYKGSLKYSIAFIAFTGEEMGLYGSKYYTDHPLFPLNSIRFEVNMDIMGTGDEGITVVNATTYKVAFNDMVKLNDSLHLLKLVKPRGETANSDHYFFYEHHVPDFFIYTMGGIKAYHDIYDRRETLPLTDFDNVFKLLQLFTADACNHKF